MTLRPLWNLLWRIRCAWNRRQFDKTVADARRRRELAERRGLL